MKYRIRQYVKHNGDKIFFAERKGWFFWHSVWVTDPIVQDPISYETREAAMAAICSDIHRRTARTVTLAEYEVK